MNRIELSSVSAGSVVHTFGVNPYFYDAQDSVEVSSIKVLHGASIWHKTSFDDRPRILRWNNILVSDANMAAISTYIRSIKGLIRFFNFQDMNDMNDGWPSTAIGDSSTWKKARIINFKVTYSPGGQLQYNTVELIIQPET